MSHVRWLAPALFFVAPWVARAAAPVIVSQPCEVNEDVACALVLSASDDDLDPLTWSIDTRPAHGTIVGTMPNVQVVPAADFSGTDRLVVAVTDGTTRVTTEISLRFLPVEDPPRLLGADFNVREDTDLPLVLAGFDPDGDTIQWSLVRAPTVGVLFGTVPNVTYHPRENANGPDSFEIALSDGRRVTTDTVRITVLPANDPPVFDVTAFDGLEDLTLPILIEATDVDRDVLTWTLVSQPTKGVLDGDPPAFDYVPLPNANGVDTFRVAVSDGATTVETTIEVRLARLNDPPLATPVELVTRQLPVDVVLAGTDPDGDDLTYELTSLPQHGTVTSLRYQPARGFVGDDVFTFRAIDPFQTTSESTVTVHVLNAPPVVTARATPQSVPPGTPVRFTATATDPGDDVTIHWNLPGIGRIDGATAETTYVTGGTLTAQVVGDDGHAEVAIDVQVEVQEVPPEVAVEAPASVEEGAMVTLTASATDANQDTLTYEWVPPEGPRVSGAAFDHTFGDDGIEHLRVRVSDGHSVTVKSVDVTVTNVAPVVTFAHTALVGRVGRELSTRVQASDPAGAADPLVVRVSEGPGVLGDDGQWRWTPDRPGTFRVTVTASDDDGGVSTATLDLEVEAEPVFGGGGCASSSVSVFALGVFARRRRR